MKIFNQKMHGLTWSEFIELGAPKMKGQCQISITTIYIYIYNFIFSNFHHILIPSHSTHHKDSHISHKIYVYQKCINISAYRIEATEKFGIPKHVRIYLTTPSILGLSKFPRCGSSVNLFF